MRNFQVLIIIYICVPDCLIIKKMFVTCRSLIRRFVWDDLILSWGHFQAGQHLSYRFNQFRKSLYLNWSIGINLSLKEQSGINLMSNDTILCFDRATSLLCFHHQYPGDTLYNIQHTLPKHLIKFALASQVANWCWPIV